MIASGSAVQLRHYGRVHKLEWTCSKRGPCHARLSGRVGLESLKRTCLHTHCLLDNSSAAWTRFDEPFLVDDIVACIIYALPFLVIALQEQI